MNTENNILFQNPDGIIGVGNISMGYVDGLKEEFEKSSSKLDVFKSDVDFKIKMTDQRIDQQAKYIFELESSFRNLKTKYTNLERNFDKAFNKLVNALVITSTFILFLLFGFVYTLINL
jgi:hypothetical protein